MLPLRGSMMPLMVFKMVVLPAPLEPSTVAISPRRTCRLTPRIALIGPYADSTLSSLSTGVSLTPGGFWLIFFLPLPLGEGGGEGCLFAAMTCRRPTQD